MSCTEDVTAAAWHPRQLGLCRSSLNFTELQRKSRCLARAIIPLVQFVAGPDRRFPAVSKFEYGLNLHVGVAVLVTVKRRMDRHNRFRFTFGVELGWHPHSPIISR